MIVSVIPFTRDGSLRGLYYNESGVLNENVYHHCGATTIGPRYNPVGRESGIIFARIRWYVIQTTTFFETRLRSSGFVSQWEREHYRLDAVDTYQWI